MKTTADFLDDLRAHLGVPSDNKLALAMGWERQQLRRYRNAGKTFDDRTAIKVASVLGIEPDHVLACMAAQRAIPESRSAWERIAAKVAACFLFGIALGSATPDAQAASLHNQFRGTNTSWSGPNYTYATKRARRLVRRALALVLALCRALALTLALAAPASAGDWSNEDSAREAVFIILDALDWRQTRQIARHPETYNERNPMLGEHPSVASVDRYFALGVALHAGIAYALPPKYRAPFQYVWIGIEADMVARNWRLGIKAEF